MLKLRNHFFKTTSGEWFHFSRGTCIGHLCRHLGCPKKWFWRTPGGPNNGVDFFLGIFTPLRVGWPPTPQVYFGPWEGLGGVEYEEQSSTGELTYITAGFVNIFHFSPPWRLPKLGNFRFSPPWGLPKRGNFRFPPRGKFSLFPRGGFPS